MQHNNGIDHTALQISMVRMESGAYPMAFLLGKYLLFLAFLHIYTQHTMLGFHGLKTAHLMDCP